MIVNCSFITLFPFGLQARTDSGRDSRDSPNNHFAFRAARRHKITVAASFFKTFLTGEGRKGKDNKNASDNSRHFLT